MVEIRDAVDKLFRPLSVGDYVAVARNSYQVVGQIIKITPQRLRVKTVGGRHSWEILPTERQVVRLDPDSLTFYLLRVNTN